VPDLQEQLQAILGDAEAMGQITAIAQALTGGRSAPPQAAPVQAAPAAPSPEAEFVPVDTPPPAPPPPAPSPSPAPDLSALLSALGGGEGGGLDPRLIQIALRVFSEYSAKDDEKAALLTALKPFLRPERREKLDKAASIARLSRVIRVAMELLREEGGHV